jgi:hypothetical protein
VVGAVSTASQSQFEIPNALNPDFSVSLSIDEVDPRRGEVLNTRLTIDDARNGLMALVAAADGEYLYGIDRAANVQRIDILDQTAVAVGRIEVSPWWKMVGHDAVLSPDGRRLYVGFDTGDDEHQVFADAIGVYDTATWERIAAIDLPDTVTHFALSARGDQLYAVSPFARSLVVYDTATLQEVATLSELDHTPAAVVVPGVRR